MYKKKPFFIVFEGVEGCGKSYQSKKLVKKLNKIGINPIHTREPGGTKSAESIRTLILKDYFNNGTKEKFDKYTDTLLYLAARNEHIKKTLLPAKKQKKIIISDRFTDSTYAYQVIGSKIDKKINSINQKYILKDFKPNLTIILKANFHTIYSRIKNRKNNNKFDTLKANFYRKAQNAYLSLAKKKKNYLVFDSSENTTTLEKKIFSIVLNNIK